MNHNNNVVVIFFLSNIQRIPVYRESSRVREERIILLTHRSNNLPIFYRSITTSTIFRRSPFANVKKLN